MKALLFFTLIADITLGAVTFAALFSLSMATPGKLLVGAALILLTASAELRSYQSMIFFEQTIALLEVGFKALSQKITDHSASVEDAFARHMTQMELESALAGQGKSFIYVLLVKYALWLGGGWALSRFVLPAVLFGVPRP